MTRKELANKVFEHLRKSLIVNDLVIWKAIAETDDQSLLKEYEHIEYKESKSIVARLNKECINDDT